MNVFVAIYSALSVLPLHLLIFSAVIDCVSILLIPSSLISDPIRCCVYYLSIAVWTRKECSLKSLAELGPAATAGDDRSTALTPPEIRESIGQLKSQLSLLESNIKTIMSTVAQKKKVCQLFFFQTTEGCLDPGSGWCLITCSHLSATL